MRPRTRWIAPLIGLLACLSASAAWAESALRLELPPDFGPLAAATYDTERVKVGAARLAVERVGDDRVRLFSKSGFDGGAHTIITSMLEIVAGDRLRPLSQESRSFDGSGSPLGTMHIDHAGGIARCIEPDGSLRGEVEMPNGERVANMTMSLLFLPLVRGDTDEMEFQVFVCSLGMRIIDFSATRAPHNGNGVGAPAVRIRYGPDLGVASRFAGGLLPTFSFWYDAAAPHGWMAHRIPLYGDGPEVYVVRDGVSTGWLKD